MDFKWFEVLEIQFDSVYDWVRLPFVSECCNQHLPNMYVVSQSWYDVKAAETIVSIAPLSYFPSSPCGIASDAVLTGFLSCILSAWTIGVHLLLSYQFRYLALK